MTEKDLGGGKEKSRPFEIKNHYNPGQIYKRLTADGVAHSIILGNDWADRRKHNYDPVVTLEAKVKTDIPKSEGHKSREALPLFNYKARIEVRTEKGKLNLKDLGERLSKKGMDFNLVTNKKLQKSGLLDKCLVAGGDNPEVMLKFFDIEYDIYTVLLSVPGEDDTSITTQKAFEKVHNSFFTVLDHLLETIYEVEEKDLPKEGIRFFDREKNSSFNVQCGHCRSIYSSYDNFECPGCSSSEPVMKDGKIVYL